MPYHTERKGKKYQTVSDTGKVLGTHSTKKQAQAQSTAVNISEGFVPGLKPRKRSKKG